MAWVGRGRASGGRLMPISADWATIEIALQRAGNTGCPIGTALQALERQRLQARVLTAFIEEFEVKAETILEALRKDVAAEVDGGLGRG